MVGEDIVAFLIYLFSNIYLIKFTSSTLLEHLSRVEFLKEQERQSIAHYLKLGITEKRMIEKTPSTQNKKRKLEYAQNLKEAFNKDILGWDFRNLEKIELPLNEYKAIFGSYSEYFQQYLDYFTFLFRKKLISYKNKVNFVQVKTEFHQGFIHIPKLNFESSDLILLNISIDSQKFLVFGLIEDTVEKFVKIKTQQMNLEKLEECSIFKLFSMKKHYNLLDSLVNAHNSSLVQYLVNPFNTSSISLQPKILQESTSKFYKENQTKFFETCASQQNGFVLLKGFIFFLIQK